MSIKVWRLGDVKRFAVICRYQSLFQLIYHPFCGRLLLDIPGTLPISKSIDKGCSGQR